MVVCVLTPPSPIHTGFRASGIMRISKFASQAPAQGLGRSRDWGTLVARDSVCLLPPL